MTIYLIDTNILSELARRRPDPRVLEWSAGVNAVGLSVITIGEILYGLAWKPNARLRRGYEEFFSQCQIFPITPLIAVRAGELRGQFRAEGKSRTQADMLMAATAASNGLTLVTRNSRDFEGCRIPLLNPFSK